MVPSPAAPLLRRRPAVSQERERGGAPFAAVAMAVLLGGGVLLLASIVCIGVLTGQGTGTDTTPATDAALVIAEPVQVAVVPKPPEPGTTEGEQEPPVQAPTQTGTKAATTGDAEKAATEAKTKADAAAKTKADADAAEAKLAAAKAAEEAARRASEDGKSIAEADKAAEALGSWSLVTGGWATNARLRGGGQDYAPGPVPAGTYDIYAAEGDGARFPAGKVTIVSGAAVRVRCPLGFQICQGT